ncbi:expressed unknown protein [Seminavis robusta]|uniref:Uncharacterized protein n=1 Tax=Seminavis robusta TaxID=568900 RepID=A0A9N8F5R6_9STRA|nr:expressed unknown protein [Seminavis robusta]|eukprot:Sro3601_g349570.1 n/a (280) ;mRNA; r:2809-3754
MTTSASAQEAVAYLNEKKPLGAWSVETKGGAVMRLLRRKIAVTDSYFLDIAHDPASGCVVGILSKGAGKAQGQVLVDRDGKLAGSKAKIISVSSFDPNRKKPASSRSSTTTRASTTTTAPTTNTNTNNNTLSDEENKKLIQYALTAIVGVVILRLITQALSILAILIVPAVYLYALQTCPHESSFDAKKELRRILRGHHLPESHPDKPKNFLDRTFARVSAAVTTELATGLGYEVSMMSFWGAAWFTSVRVPTSQLDFYWIGAFGQWTYVYSKKYETEA